MDTNFNRALSLYRGIAGKLMNNPTTIVKISSHRIESKKEKEQQLSKQRLQKMKGKKNRKNRGNNRSS